MEWTKEKIEAFVKSNLWYQSIELPFGIRTKGSFETDMVLKNIKFPESFAKKTYLDIGSNAGFYVLEAKRRGASLSCGIDKEKGQIEKARIVADILKMHVSYYNKNIYQCGDFPMPFHVVSAMSVFHHFKYPLQALRIIRRLTTELFIGEFACWVEGVTKWKPLDEYPEDLGAKYHLYYPTVECMRKTLSLFFGSVEVIGESKKAERIAFHARV
jgi:SAM-dependent methyltransferase